MRRSNLLEQLRLLSATGCCLVVAAACNDSADDMTGPAAEPGTFNAAPVAIGAVPPVRLASGESAQIDVSAFFEDPEGDPLSYTATTTDALVAGASVSGSVMVVVGVSTGQVGGRVLAHDPAGGQAVQTFFVEVRNRPPVTARSLPTVYLAPGQSEQFDLRQHFADPDGDVLTFGATTSNALVAGASVSGHMLTVGAVGGGAATLTVTARDPVGSEVRQSSAVVVSG